ncbi:MAG: prepilin-type N-terminal cleavage/methylation domain-containing protein [Candidatus Spechtbacterales bacterium]|nr:prepilin-type N-terminal cleavage/methylation domain-containing protein [Candidatus Spechtbacterales bacterium]
MNKNYFKTKKRKLKYSLIIERESGFTFIEILVIMAIMSILMGILVGTSRSSTERYALQRSAQTVTQAINIAKSNALASKKHPDASGTASPGGYGLNMPEGGDTLTLFADCNQSSTLNTAGGGASTCEAAASAGVFLPEIVGEYPLEPNIIIGRIDRCGSPSPQQRILFIPPDPEVIFNQPLGVGCNEVAVRLDHSNGSSITVYINKIGVTYIQ